MSKQKNSVRFGMVFAGLVFFFNPNVALFDLLPDVVGALLLYWGLKNASEAGAYFDDARSISFVMIWLYAVKSVFAVSLLRYPANALPYTFLSGVLETIILLRFFARLYDGFEYSAMRSGNGETAAYVKNVRALSYIFAVCRSVFAFLPEILELLQQNDDLDLSANAAYRMPIIRLKPYVLLFCMTVTLLLGILYLIRTRAFFARVKKDTALTDYLTDLYRDAHQNDRARYASGAFGTSLVLLAAAAVFAADFTLDGLDYLPDIFGVFCVAAAFFVLTRFDGGKMPVLPLLLYAAAGLCGTVIGSVFRPKAFTVLSAVGFGNRQMSPLARFFESAAAPLWACAAGILYTAFTVYLLAAWTKRAKGFCVSEKIGTYDAKFLSCTVLYGLAVLCKSLSWILEAARAHLACNDEVAKHLAARSHMSAARLSEAVAQNDTVALFETLDSLAPAVTAASLAFAFFAVLAFVSFKAASARAFDPNAEE